MNTTVKKVLRDPLGAARRTIEKVVVGPLRYRKGRGYDAEAYWGDRFSRYGRSLRGPGDEGLSETDNDRDYAVADETFRGFCAKNQLDFATVKTLEIGPGTGFYTRHHGRVGRAVVDQCRHHRRAVRRIAQGVAVGRAAPR